MRSYPELDYERKELEELNCDQWMIDLLKLNPEYTFWGPHEDYMIGKNKGWASPIFVDSWKEFSIKLDELNKVVNFYFELTRDSTDCTTCAGSGYHPDAQWITESFYSHSSPFRFLTIQEEEEHEKFNTLLGISSQPPIHDHGSYPNEETLAKYKPEFKEFCEEMRYGFKHCWGDDLDDQDLALLKSEGRNHGDFRDAIDRCILCKGRCERYGIPHTCPECDGHGYVYTAEKGHLQLVLWLIHPRKGAGRGVEVKLVEQEDLPSVFKFLREAHDRNAARFSGVVNQ